MRRSYIAMVMLAAPGMAFAQVPPGAIMVDRQERSPGLVIWLPGPYAVKGAPNSELNRVAAKAEAAKLLRGSQSADSKIAFGYVDGQNDIMGPAKAADLSAELKGCSASAPEDLHSSTGRREYFLFRARCGSDADEKYLAVGVDSGHIKSIYLNVSVVPVAVRADPK